MSSTAFSSMFKLNNSNSKQTQVVCTIFGLQTLNRFSRSVFLIISLKSKCFVKKSSDFLACMFVQREGAFANVFVFSPFESERLASVWTTKKWGMSPGWNLLSISSMISLMCLLPTATKMLLAACCQSGMTSCGTQEGREKRLRKVIPDLASARKGCQLNLSYCTFDRVISSEAKEMILFILG